MNAATCTGVVIRTLLLAIALVAVTAAIGAGVAVIDSQSAIDSPVTADFAAVPSSAGTPGSASISATPASTTSPLPAPTASLPLTRTTPVTRTSVAVRSTATLGPPDSAFDGLLGIATPDQFAVTASPGELRYSFTGPLAVYVSYAVKYVGGQGCAASDGTWLGQRRGYFSAGACTDLVGARLIFTPSYPYTSRGVTAASFTVEVKAPN
jgi:hypothetical protein